MPHEALVPAFQSLIAPDAPLRVIGTGFEFTEGPVWHPRQRALVFSDIPGNTSTASTEKPSRRMPARPARETA